MLRGWRVGSDIMAEAERIITEAGRRYKRDEGEAAGKERKASGKPGPSTIRRASEQR